LPPRRPSRPGAVERCRRAPVRCDQVRGAPHRRTQADSRDRMKVGPCTASRPSAVRAGGLQRWPASALSSHTAAAGSASPDAPQEARHDSGATSAAAARCDAGGAGDRRRRTFARYSGDAARRRSSLLASSRCPATRETRRSWVTSGAPAGSWIALRSSSTLAIASSGHGPFSFLYHYTHRPTTRPKAYCLELVARWLQRHGWHASHAPQHSLTSSASGKPCSSLCSSEGRAEHAQVSSRVLFLARCLLGPKAVSLRYSPVGKTINLFQAQETLCTHSQTNQLTHSSQPLWVSSTRSRGQSQVRRQT